MEAEGEGAKKKSGVPGWVTGCAAALLLVFLGCVGGGWLLVRWLRDMAWEKGTEGMVAALEAGGFPADEVDEFRGEMQRLRAGRESGTVDLSELGSLAREVLDGPMLPVGVVQFFEHDALPRAGLPAEEGARAVVDLQRFERGLWEGTIPRETWERVFRVQEGSHAEVVVGGEDHGWHASSRTSWKSPEEIRAILHDVRQEVDRAGIPDEVFSVRLSEEFGKLVDERLQD